jgi:hypothetical protein
VARLNTLDLTGHCFCCDNLPKLTTHLSGDMSSGQLGELVMKIANLFFRTATPRGDFSEDSFGYLHHSSHYSHQTKFTMLHAA